MTDPDPSTDVLVVCTANVCRSPVAEALLRRHLVADRAPLVISSAGTHGGRNVVHADTEAAAAEVGIDLSRHRSRRLTRRLLDAEGGCLVVAMSREHVYHIVATDESVWPHTFTLAELVRRAEALAETGARFDALRPWVAALGDGRRSSDLLPGRPEDDIADPYGRPRRHHRRMVRQVEELCMRVSAAASVVLIPGDD